MSTRETHPSLTEITWKQARKAIAKICPKLANIIDEISPDDSFTFIKAQYPFGTKIIHKGVANLPTEHGGTMSSIDTKLTKAVRSKLSYNRVPLGVITRNGAEVFREIENRVFSVAFLESGLQLGVWEHFDWITPYTVTAGARSLYLLPQVKLSQAHNRLKRKYNITLPPPKQPFYHWHLFKQMVNSPDFSEAWSCEVMYLTKRWIDHLEEGGAWTKLNKYITAQGWNHSEYARRKSIFDVIWQIFSLSLNSKGIKPNIYVLDTLKHLTFIGTGLLPASQPATESSSIGPTDGIQQAYLDTYMIQDYIPTIMQPGYLLLNKTNSVYYSLQTPTLLESVPQSKNLTSIIDNVRELKELTEHFLTEAFEEHLAFGKTSIADNIKQLSFEFFHEQPYAYGHDIRPSNEMPDNDSTLLYQPASNRHKNEKLQFAHTSPYLHGCVRISAKRKTSTKK